MKEKQRGLHESLLAISKAAGFLPQPCLSTILCRDNSRVHQHTLNHTSHDLDRHDTVDTVRLKVLESAGGSAGRATLQWRGCLTRTRSTWGILRPQYPPASQFEWHKEGDPKRRSSDRRHALHVSVKARRRHSVQSSPVRRGATICSVFRSAAPAGKNWEDPERRPRGEKVGKVLPRARALYHHQTLADWRASLGA